MNRVKYIIILVLFLLGLNHSLSAQKMAGSWKGVLYNKAINIPLVYHFAQQKGNWLATMDSPDQNAYDIPADSVGIGDSTIVIKHGQMGMVYKGVLIHKDTFKGIFTQRGISLPLTIVRAKTKNQSTFLLGFDEEEVLVPNKKAGVNLAATLTYPKEGKDFPAVILISGSGPQGRDVTLFGKKLFKTVAEHFTRSGYAVLRYDDRGIAKSTGNFATATSFDFANDVESILKFLGKHKKINKDQIGLMGHSEGSLIASIVASRNKNVAFVLSVAGPGVRGDSLILSQAKLIMEGNGMADTNINSTLGLNRSIYRIVMGEGDSISKDHRIRSTVRAHYQSKPETLDSIALERMTNSLALQSNSKWFETFLNYDPALYWRKVKCPVFAVNGVKDVQVPAVANLMGIKNHLERAENYDAKIKMYPNLNHLMQTCKTGLPSEYPGLSETFSGIVLNDMVQWLNTIVKL